MILFDATHTSHTSARTGIQRVCRSLFEELYAGGQAAPICYDPHLMGWRSFRHGELAVLRYDRGRAARSRGIKWTLAQKISGTAGRWLGKKSQLPAATGLICPEIFSAQVGARLPELFAQVAGPRIAVFYDTIPLQFPELTPPGTVARFPAYLRELLQFDGVAAISATSAASLRDYWQWLGITNPPPVAAIPLGVEVRHITDDKPSGPLTPRILSVGTIEGRKNHLALLEACEALWRDGVQFELQLIGLARPDTAGPALEKIATLRRADRPLLYAGVATDAAIESAYRQCTFTVYPSLIEGFGLPVLESLSAGKPCICSARGALGESARDGGCLTLEAVDGASLAAAIRRLLGQPGELAALAAAARARRFKTWSDYARELTGWMQTLPRRA